jgi:hypothetical protein
MHHNGSKGEGPPRVRVRACAREGTRPSALRPDDGGEDAGGSEIGEGRSLAARASGEGGDEGGEEGRDEPRARGSTRG